MILKGSLQFAARRILYRYLEKNSELNPRALKKNKPEDYMNRLKIVNSILIRSLGGATSQRTLHFYGQRAGQLQLL